MTNIIGKKVILSDGSHDFIVKSWVEDDLTIVIVEKGVYFHCQCGSCDPEMITELVLVEEIEEIEECILEGE